MTTSRRLIEDCLSIRQISAEGTWTLDKAQETRFLMTSPLKSGGINLFQVKTGDHLARENGFLVSVVILSKVQGDTLLKITDRGVLRRVGKGLATAYERA